MEEITVSVAMTAYNHGKYIKQAIDSVLHQQTDFKYELVVGDDASPDNTQEIIKELYKKHPDKLKPILREKNIGAIKNIVDIVSHCNGKYVAFLEGDDFWTDPNKLQKQVDFLEKNPDYVACFHKNKVVDEDNNIISEKDMSFCKHEEYTLEDYRNFDLPGQTGTSIVRGDVFKQFFLNETINDIYRTVRYTPGDRILSICLLFYGKIYCSNDVMSAYRSVIKSKASNWSSRYAQDNAFVHLHFVKMRREIEEIGQKLGIEISYEKEEYEAFIDACWKYRFLGKKKYAFNIIYMLCRSNHKKYLKENGIPKVKAEIKARAAAKKSRRKENKNKLKEKLKSKMRGVKRRCQKLLNSLKNLKTDR